MIIIDDDGNKRDLGRTFLEVAEDIHTMAQGGGGGSMYLHAINIGGFEDDNTGPVEINLTIISTSNTRMTLSDISQWISEHGSLSALYPAVVYLAINSSIVGGLIEVSRSGLFAKQNAYTVAIPPSATVYDQVSVI